VRFDRGSPEHDDQPIYVAGNRWYFFLPLPMVGLWLLVAAAELVASLVAPSAFGSGSEGPADLFQDALAVMDWVGVLGWVLLIPFYFVVLASKRASPWWLLGAFCCGPNLLLYVVLLFLPSHRRWMAGHDARDSPTIDSEQPPRPPTFLLRDSFVCGFCDSLLNYGVSECHECGQRYRYADGKPILDT
jgi:hypothetical protein